ncbi:hypothetical protein PsalN5692_00588 [Piscirickettsia salmonis]|uniref:hypothetical protein n=1 Tax=Piscirickettsia salmonis TaxID=1238 RepID=UPI0012B92CE1|nr:hypothetical protein [Piscirickettsia salmonis]QGP49166.1 hypothetical protein PsalN5692_00588 [Piscirickettsia salmonis]
MVSRERYSKINVRLSQATALIVLIISFFIWGLGSAYFAYGLLIAVFIGFGAIFLIKVLWYGTGDLSKPLTIKECVSLYCFQSAWLVFTSILAFTAVFLLVHMTINFFAKG